MWNVYGLGPAGSSFILALKQPVYAYDPLWVKYGRLRSACAGGLGFYAIDKIVKYLPEASEAINKATATVFKEFEYVGVNCKVLITADDLRLKYLGVIMDREVFDKELADMANKYVEDLITSKTLKDGKVVIATGFTDMPEVSDSDKEVLLQYWVETEDVTPVVRISFIKDYLKSGYYWEFPEVKNGLVKVGIGVSCKELMERRVNTDYILRKFMSRFNVKGKVIKASSALLPLAKWRETHMFRDGKIHIGTAGGFVNPATGAGIMYAILSGVAVARNDFGLIKELAKEINRFYRVKQLITLAPQRVVDKAICSLVENMDKLDLKNLYGFKNYATVITSFIVSLIKF